MAGIGQNREPLTSLPSAATNPIASACGRTFNRSPKKAMDFLGRHRVSKLLRIVDTGGGDHRLRLCRTRSTACIERAVCSARTIPRCAYFLPGARNGFFAPVPDGHAGGHGNDDEQPDPDKRKVSAGAKTTVLQAVGFHHAATLAKDALATNEGRCSVAAERDFAGSRPLRWIGDARYSPWLPYRPGCRAPIGRCAPSLGEHPARSPFRRRMLPRSSSAGTECGAAASAFSTSASAGSSRSRAR